jgi:hypothetical protein
LFVDRDAIARIDREKHGKPPAARVRD